MFYPQVVQSVFDPWRLERSRCAAASRHHHALTDRELRMASDSAALDAALREADAVVKKLEFQFGLTIADNGKRAVAGVLYQQQHGGSFPAIQRLFPSA